jgi:hypothetical protein
MSQLHDRLSTLDVTVTTPDGFATARLRGRSSVWVSLAPGYFTTTTPGRLADQLAKLGELLWRSTLSSPRNAGFRTGPDAVVCEGRSADGSVSMCTMGMTTWIVELEPPAFMRGEEAFCAAAGEALSGALADRLPQLHRLAGLGRARRERKVVVDAGRGVHR